MTPLSVGNGKFAFTVDPTGLQTFPEIYDTTVALCTMADYGWHKMPNPNNYTIEETYKEFDSHGRMVKYVYDHRVKGDNDMQNEAFDRQKEASKWFLENPTRMGLGGLSASNLQRPMAVKHQ